MRRGAAALAIAIAGVAVAGCSSSASSTKTPASAVTPTTVTRTTSCGGDVANVVKQHLSRPDVVDVRVIGGCHDLTIATSLDATAAASGQAICDRAAEVAYASDTGIRSITVLAASNRELSIGLKGQSCLAEP